MGSNAEHHPAQPALHRRRVRLRPRHPTRLRRLARPRPGRRRLHPPDPAGRHHRHRRTRHRPASSTTRTPTSLPDGAIYKACGNRRASVCPSCARTYQRDAYQLLRAGLVGGKGVPDTVARHPAVFATFTAPSFGTVHTRDVKQHTCANRKRCDCRPEPCHARRDDPNAGLCPHGRPGRLLGPPRPRRPRPRPAAVPGLLRPRPPRRLEPTTGELWHRTKQAAERYLAPALPATPASPASPSLTDTGNVRAVPPVRLSHGKAAEFQARGAVHFHALLRLDGVDPDDPDAVDPATGRHRRRRPRRRRRARRRAHRLHHPGAPRPARRLADRLGRASSTSAPSP